MENTNDIKIESLKFENITFAHENHDPTLLQSDFEFPMDSVVWVKSSEGEGKSTILQILAGLLIPQHGKYFINNEDVADMSFEDFLPYRLKIGYSFDYGGLINNRTVFENILLPLAYHKVVPYRDAKLRVENLIQRFDIDKFKNERPAHIPGRVRKLTCLLRALVMKPQLLLMDDPSVGLGHDTAQEFVDLIHDMRSEGDLKHIFLSSYDDKFMNMFSYKVIHIDQSQIHQTTNDEKKVANL